MIIVVTGSRGFIGRNLLHELRQSHPGAELRCLVRTPPLLPGEFPVEYRDPGSLSCTPALEGADLVFHVAGVTRGLSAEDFRTGNVLPTRTLLETLVRRGIALRRFVLISSQAAAGPSRSRSHFRTEEEPPEPAEAYGRAKLEAETIVRSFARQVPCTIIRPGAVFGPYDAAFLNIFRMTRFGLNLYPGYKHRFVSYVFAADLVRAVVDAAGSCRTLGNSYFVCNDKPATWQEIHETVFALAARRALSLNIPLPLLMPFSVTAAAAARFLGRPAPLLRPQGLRLSQHDWIASNGAARRDFGFAPAHDLQTGLERTYQWYREAGKL